MDRRTASAVLLLIVAVGVPAVAEEEMRFNRDVRPILSDACFSCHGFDESSRRADLRLDIREGATADLGGYQAIVPGDPASSEAWRRITTDDADDRMPPPDAVRQLNEDEIATLRRWIESGAAYEPHWAFTPPHRPDPPDVGRADWPRNPIDRFVLARLEDEGLAPSAEADRVRLIRRLSLDLTGLPPTPAEVDAFVRDDAADAYDRLVERLLASPRYGERMAWDWLEAGRYADSNGYQGDRERTMWPWRDWVVDAFNRNMPYDRFTVWQIAGDLLPDATDEQKLATGFNRNHMINGEGGRIAEENRVEYIFDQLETVSTVWLGLTFNCARCHDHKFDPITQRDYYSLFAFFNQTPVTGAGGDPQTAPNLAVPTAEQSARIAQLQQRVDEFSAQREERRRAIASQQADLEPQALADLPRGAWHVLQPTAADAEHQQLEVLDDHSILATGPTPANDTYTVTTTGEVERITGFRLEALRHESFPNGGLSRAGGNYVLTSFEVSILRSGRDEPRRLAIASAEASFEQGGFPIADALDGKADTGWGVWNGSGVDGEQQAIFRLAEPIDLRPEDRLIVVLRHDSPHGNHIIGRLRLAATTDVEPQLTAPPPELGEAFETPADQRDDTQKELVIEHLRETDDELPTIRRRIEQTRAAIRDVRSAMPKVMVMADTESRKTYVLDTGLYNEPRDEVEIDTPSYLPPLPDDAPRNRLGLARWLVSPDNPLTARVTVNRLWAQFFGEGLVKGPEDFGTQSESPSHPGLLDWLAVEFIDSGWDIKAMVRLIVTSAVYRQSSKVSPELLARDPDNRLLARGPRFRMPSWMLRDQALFAGGLMTGVLGGPPVNPYQPPGVWEEATFGNKTYERDTGAGLYRRSLYVFWRRIVGPTMFFDAAARQVCTVEQARTNTPLHALTTLNDITYVEAARAMAGRVLRAVPDPDDGRRIDRAFRLVLARTPNDSERKVLRRSIRRLRTQYAAEPSAAEALLNVGDSEPDPQLDPVEHAAWTGLCSAILNLDEALTKE